MTWIIDNIPLSTLAFNVRNRAAGWRVPAKRGDNLVIPGRDGSQWIPNKPFEEGSISLSMWANGATEEGLIPEHGNQRRQARDNLDKLSALFAQSAKLLEVIQISGLAFGALNTAKNPGFEHVGSDTYYTYQNSVINPAMRRKAAATQFTNLFANPAMATAQSPLWWPNFENIVLDPYNKLGRTASPAYYQSNYWAPPNFENYSAGDTIGSNWTVASNTTATVQSNTAADQTANPLGGTKVFRVLATAALGANASLGVRPPMYALPGSQPHLRLRFRRAQNTSTTRTFQMRMIFQSPDGTWATQHPWKTFAIPNGSSTWADAMYTREDYTNTSSTLTDPLEHVRVEFRTGEAWAINDGLIIDCVVMGHTNYTSGPFQGVAGPFWDGNSPWGGTSWASTDGTSISRWYAQRDTRWVAAAPTSIANAYFAAAEFPGTDSAGTTVGFIAHGVQSGGTQVFTYQAAAVTPGTPYTLKFNWRGRSGTSTKVGLYKQGSGDPSPVLIGEHTLAGTATPIATGTRMNGTFSYEIGPTYTAQTGDVLSIRVTVPVRMDGHHAFQFSSFHLTDAGQQFSGASASTANTTYDWAGTTYNSKSVMSQRRVKRITNDEHALISTVVIDAGGTTTTVAEAVCRAQNRTTEVVGENVAIPIDHQGLWFSADAAAGNLADSPSTNPEAVLIAELLDNSGSVLRTKQSADKMLIFYTYPSPVQWTNFNVAFAPEEVPAGATHARLTMRLAGPVHLNMSMLTSRWMIKASAINPTLGGAPAYFDGSTAGASWNGSANDSTSKYQIQYSTAWGTSGTPIASGSGLTAIGVPGFSAARVSFTTSLTTTHSPQEYLLGFEATAVQLDAAGTALFNAAGVTVRAEFLDAGGAVVHTADCGTLSGNQGLVTYETFQGAVQISTPFNQLRLVFTGPQVRNTLRVTLGRVYLCPNHAGSYTCPIQRIDFNGVHNPAFNFGIEGWSITGTTTTVDSTKGKALRLTSSSSVARSGLLAAAAGSKVHVYVWGRQSGSSGLEVEARYCKILARNLLTNPSYTKTSQPWATSRTTASRGADTINGVPRYYSRITFASATSLTVTHSPQQSVFEVPVTTGQSYFVAAWTRASKAVNARVRMSWFDAEGNPTAIASHLGPSTPIGTAWSELSTVAVAPAGAAYGRLTVESVSASWAINDTFDASCARVVPGQTVATPYWEGGDIETSTVWPMIAPDGTHLQVEYTSQPLGQITQTTYVGGFPPPMLTVPATYTHVAVAYRGNGGEIASTYLGNDFATHEAEGFYDPLLFAYMDGTMANDIYQQPTYWQGGAVDNAVSRVSPNMPSEWVFTPSSTGPNVHLATGLAVKPPGSKGKAAWVPRILKDTTRSFRTVGVARGSNVFLSGELSAAMFFGVSVTVEVWGAPSATGDGAILYYGNTIPYPSGTAVWLDLPIHYQPYYFVKVIYSEAINGSGYRLRFDNLLMMPTTQEVGGSEYPGYFDGDTNGASWTGLPNQSDSQYYGGGRRAYAEVKDAIDMTSMAGGTRAEFGVEMIIPSSFWEDLLESTHTVTAEISGPTSSTHVLDAFLGSTVPMNDTVITIARTGTVEDLVLFDVATGAWVKIDDALPATTVIDNADFTVMSGSSSLIARVTRGGSNQLLPITPESSATAPRLGVTASGTGTLTITVVGRRKYALA